MGQSQAPADVAVSMYLFEQLQPIDPHSTHQLVNIFAYLLTELVFDKEFRLFLIVSVNLQNRQYPIGYYYLERELSL